MFINNVPSQLSTYEALNTLIDLIDSQNPNDEFKNPVVKKLLLNALTGNIEPFNKNEDNDFPRKIQDVIKASVPLYLSDKQKNGIINAFQSEISYIQGPPGTGKSHTIAAIVLTAQALNKKVLVLSQKKEALKVVDKMINPILSGNTGNINGLCYYDKDKGRSDLRAYCDKLLQNYTPQRILENIISINKKLNGLTTEIKSLTEQYNASDKELSKLLSSMREHHECNENLLNDIESFNKRYNIAQDKYKLNVIHSSCKYNEVKTQLERICQKPDKFNLAAKLYLYKVYKHISNKFLFAYHDVQNIERGEIHHFFDEFVKIKGLP